MIFLEPEGPDPPPSALPDPTLRYGKLFPEYFLAAFPDEIRASPNALHDTGLKVVGRIAKTLEDVGRLMTPPVQADGLTVSTKFVKLRDFLSDGLSEVLANRLPQLAKVRLALANEVPPMSLYLGIVRIGHASTPIADILYDTSDSDLNQSAFAHIIYVKSFVRYLRSANKNGELGLEIDAT